MGNSRIYLIVGPSGGGKSTICRIVADSLPNCQHIDLDSAADVRKSGYIDLGMQIISDLEQSNDQTIYLIDIGAGFQNEPNFQAFLNSKKETVLCIFVGPEIAYQRKVFRSDGDWRSLEDYTRDEYADHRRLIYQLGTIFHNLSLDDTSKAIAAYIST